jgi:hypothetical protein
MRESEFYKDMEIDDEDRPRAERALRSKGIEMHILVKEQLMVWSENKTIRYSEVASTYRYDKRIRNTLFKYIAYVEEFYRSVILDNYHDKADQTLWIKSFKDKLERCDGNMNEALGQLSFKDLLKQTHNLPDDIKERYGLIKEHVGKNTKALNGLRNAVMHNKFLLLYRGFEICYVSGVDSGGNVTMTANILNLTNFLPDGVKEKCLTDIDNCKKDRNRDDETKWDLPMQVLVSVRKK